MTKPFVLDKAFWEKKRVFLTGHTGFKGSWMCLWLSALGAEVTGYALEPPTVPSLFELIKVHELVNSAKGDIRNAALLQKIMLDSRPEIVIHLAARPILRDSYKDPIETYSVNVMGTVHLLEAVRRCPGVRAVVNVTTDKCYENREWVWGYRENDSLGGYDPYSNSKACSELITASYRSSFFNPKDFQSHGVGIASARAGNVIGGGDWAEARLVPDCIRSFLKGEKISIRYPKAIRPWQHVLEPLSGYLLLAKRLYEDGPRYGSPWNFGPEDQDAKSVEWMVQRICAQWGERAGYEIHRGKHPHEDHYLKLDCSKAKTELGWLPRWNLEKSIEKVMEWVRAYRDGKDLRKICQNQIIEYEEAPFNRG